MASSSKEGLLSVGDKISVGQFLVDIGAEVSVYTATTIVIRIAQPGALLVAAYSSTMKTFGSVPLRCILP